MRYLVVVEQGATSYGAYVPDLPGCLAASESREEVLPLIREAIGLHLEDLRKEGQPIPAPSSFCELVEIGAA
ncbi:MAG: type II toxin-antitoxin system HicB family antitoxin [Candidatus Latescibacterota bacterium]